MENAIKSLFLESATLKQKIAENEHLLYSVSKLAAQAIETVKQGGTIFACGNGGSACDSMHLVEELVARYKRERPGIKAMHLMDPSTVTCWANDYKYEDVFARQVETFCTDKDMLIVFSTSGNSANVLAAVAAARKKGTFTAGLTGKTGGKLKDTCDLPIVIPAQSSERTQEAHITIVHILCEMIELALEK